MGLIQSVPSTALHRVVRRPSYSQGHQAALMEIVKHDAQSLQLEINNPDIVDLDDLRVWRQQKVKEKAIQLFRIMVGDDIKANILRTGLRVLIERPNFFAGANNAIRLKLMQDGYSEKTATAQANQMITLFSMLKMIVREGNEWRVNPQSLILQRISKVAQNAQRIP